ncbi:MAG: hypothetical protein ABIT71_08910 [Vicinamibacteraceae bacterium]
MTHLTRLWHTDPVLVATGLFLAALTVPFGLGLLLDPRVITGAPAWLKPVKFAVSTALYAFTLAWVFTYLPDWPRLRRVVGRGTAAAFVLEVLMIGGQAWRGTTSHFNVATPFDAVVFAAMGLVIVAQTLLATALAVALWRQRFEDPALGWALRLGVLITVLGAFTGGLMTQPTATQIADATATHQMPISGGHTVGALDGGPGLPLTGWSTRHGDVRVPHFVGLHAWQVLPLFVLVALRGGNDRRRTGVAIAAASLYAIAFVALLVQALRGLPALPI